MSRDYNNEKSSLPTEVADRILARAAELDAAPAGALSVARLREIAAEAGISSEALAAALHENATVGSARTTVEEPSVPGWVRLCLFGVPDRVAALRYYWIFVAGLLGSPLLATLYSTPITGGVIAAGFATFCAGALWSTSRAVRWLDRHGWQRLA
jgi:hypothetical protein